MSVANLQSLCWIAGSIRKRRLTNPRSVTEKRAKFIANIGIKQQKTDLFDRFFRVVLAVPTGLETATRNYLGAQ